MQPKILTRDLYRLYLADVVIGDYLRQPSDLDIDLDPPDPADAPEDKLILARERLDLFVQQIEEEVLLKYSEPRVRVSPGRFDPFFPTLGAVHLLGYREVTQEEVDTGTDLPSTPDGEDYEEGDPNIITSDEDLIKALRQTIAAVAEHEVQRPDRTITRKSREQSREDYDLTERPSGLYRKMLRFDIRRSHHYL